MKIINKITAYSFSLLMVSSLLFTLPEFTICSDVYADEFDGDIIENPFDFIPDDEDTDNNATDNNDSDTTNKTDSLIVTSASVKMKFQLDKASKKAVLLESTDKKRKTADIPSSLSYKNTVYKVTSIGDNAFKNHKKLKSVTLGKYITKIGIRSFYGCKSLKKISISSNRLKSVGKYAFKKVPKKIKIYVPKKKLKTYKKLLLKKGISKKSYFKKLS